MKIVLGIFCLLLLSGCGSDEQEEKVEIEQKVEIEGQVFVVTKGRENIKMGLVPIHVVPDEDFKKIAYNLAEQIMDFQVEAIQRKANNQAREKFIQELLSLEKSDLKVPALATLREEAARPIAEGLVKNRFTPDEGLDFAKELLYSRLPPSLINTDADGRFKISVDSKFWVIAQGERSVGEETEDYLWILPVEKPKVDSASPLLISNNSGYDSIENLYTLLASAGDKAQDLRLPSLSSAKVDQETAEWIKQGREKANSLVKAVMVEKQAMEAKLMVEKQAMEAKLKARHSEIAANHSEIVANYTKTMTDFMEGMGSITDEKSAKAFVKTIEGLNATLKELVAAAEVLDPPTDEEKEAMKAIKESFEGKGQAIGQKMFQMMAKNPDAEAIGAVLMESLNNPQMKEMDNKLWAIYDLED